jgi:hypothetical protein
MEEPIGITSHHRQPQSKHGMTFDLRPSPPSEKVKNGLSIIAQ